LKLGYSSIRWKKLGTPLPQILDGIWKAGFQGCELQDSDILLFEKNADSLHAMFQERNLELSSIYTYGSLQKNLRNISYDVIWWRRLFPKILRTASVVECKHLILGGGVKEAGVREKDTHKLAKSLEKIGRICHQSGLKLSYHPQIGSNVSTLSLIERICGLTDPEIVSIAVDTGHLRAMRLDPADAISCFEKRVGFVHFKDIKDCRFVELGKGCIDFPKLMALLESIKYDGWIVIEDEDEKTENSPLESARNSKEYMHVCASTLLPLQAVSKHGLQKAVTQMENKVAIVKAGKEDISASVSKAIDLIGGFTPKPNSKIVIKPNLCSAKKLSQDGVTTDVKVTEAVIKYIQKKADNCKITIVESDGESDSAEKAFEKNGYKNLIKEYGVDLCNLSKEPHEEVLLTNAKWLKTLSVPKSLLSMDYLISIAKMKRHIWERFTGVWKNQYGLMTNPKMRQSLHPFLSEALYDLNTRFRPNLCLIDGLKCLEGPGPVAGKPKEMNIIAASYDPLAIDVVATKLIGENPRNVPHLKYALNHGFEDSENAVLVGETDAFSNCAKFDFIPDNVYRRWRFYLFRQKWLTRIRKTLGR
jgi:uncharacterized protein (DUF362 family)/sugar phosphate isomerase/epimerase